MSGLLSRVLSVLRGLRVSYAARGGTWISVEGIAKAVTREREHREWLERPPGDEALVSRIKTSGRFLRGTNIGGRRTA